MPDIPQTLQNESNCSAIDDFIELVSKSQVEEKEKRKEKFFLNLLRNYFNKETPCYGYDFNILIRKIEQDRDYTNKLNNEIRELGDLPKEKFTCEPEIFDFPNKNKRRYFKYINFFHYYYACLMLKEKFFDTLDDYFRDNKNFGVYNCDLIKFSEGIIYDPLDEFLRHSDIKDLFEKKYKHKDIEIISSYDYILECDIANFFPSIYTHLFPRILDKDYSNGKYESFNDIKNIGQFIDYFTRYNQNKETIGLPIGSILYSIFAEIISIHIDSILIKFLDDKKIDYCGSRVTDDRTIGFKNRHDADMALQKLREILHDNKLHLNYEKTKIFTSSEFYKEIWTNDIYVFINEYEKYAEQFIQFDDEESKDKILKKLTDSVNQFNNTIFYWFNNLKNSKDKQSIIKYAAKVLSSNIKKYKILDKAHINLIVRLIKIYSPIIRFLLDTVNILQNDRTHRILQEVINLICNLSMGQGGEILWCLKYINDIDIIENNELKQKLFTKEVKQNVLKTKNSFCFKIWNDICIKNNKNKFSINASFCSNGIFHCLNKSDEQKKLSTEIKNLLWFRIMNNPNKCDKCKCKSKYNEIIEDLIILTS